MFTSVHFTTFYCHGIVTWVLALSNHTCIHSWFITATTWTMYMYMSCTVCESAKCDHFLLPFNPPPWLCSVSTSQNQNNASIELHINICIVHIEFTCFHNTQVTTRPSHFHYSFTMRKHSHFQYRLMIIKPSHFHQIKIIKSSNFYYRLWLWSIVPVPL